MLLFSHNLIKRTIWLNQKIQIMENRCIQFCLRLDKMHHTSLTEFRSIKWLPTKERVDQYINAKLSVLSIITALFIWMKSLNSLHNVEKTQQIVLQGLRTLFPSTDTGQKTLSYIGPSLWYNLPKPIKKRIIQTISNTTWINAI